MEKNLPTGQAGKTGKPIFAAGRYLKYAIGEIILVVIGIIIALQINNSNELRKEKDQETIILSDIKEDFLATRLNFLETIKNQERSILGSRDLIDAIEAQDYSIHPDLIRKYILRGAFSHHPAIAITGSYNAIIGSGKTSIIKNKELLKALANFSSQYQAGFEDETKSDNLLNLMMAASKDFYSPLSDDVVRKSIALKKKYSLQEKEIAVKNLYENEAFLAFLIQKTKWETSRATYHKKLLKSLNKVLYQFNFNELTPEKEVYSKYIGNYTNKAVEPIKISYANESLYVTGWGGAKSELVQLKNSLFYAISWNQTLEFISDDNATNKVLTQWMDRDPVEFEKVEN
ncbi:hypothetical protein K8354_04465 [Polaribacter litorisediminis]|uniref:DUF6090 family protein n=1 Tax=Polaribacter litorisediminis TaxID=1908341 RepID=UPI001CBF429F|nr:DUF6090 family protein [Polaribacter litorisediminis]UAM99084.1 hypothetical protein K8354_04465 [Polaribacter litorisediminis]